MEWPEKITSEMDKDVNGIWFSSFSPLPLVYGKCDYIRADLVAYRELEIVRATLEAARSAIMQFEDCWPFSNAVEAINPKTILDGMK